MKIRLVAFFGFLLFIVGCQNEGSVSTGPAKNNKLADGAKSYTGGIAVVVADMNGDGHLDIVSACPFGGIKWFENNGKGEFFDRGVIAKDNAESYDGGISIAVADIDGNGIPDIIIGAPFAGINIIKNPVPKKTKS